jgi:hypothetical protein
MADRSHKFTKLVTKTIKWSKPPQSPTQAVGVDWSGITAVASSTVVISTTAVASGAMVSLTLRAMAPNSADLLMGMWVVRSINPGAAFSIGTVYSYALISSYQAHWTLGSKV